ncbi:MAG: AAA family ATPase [Hyphomonadaceae bacterium]
MSKGITGILFTDIEGSVAKWEMLPDEMSAALERHNQLVASIVAKHRGVIHDRVGDGASVRFPVGNPLECALDLQDAFRQQDWSDIGGLSLRVSVHAFQGGDDGHMQPAINRAARMVDAAWGGQIVVSAFAVAAYQAPLKGRLSDLGSVHLRGIAAPMQLLSLTGGDWIEDTFPPLRGVDRQTPDLPARSTPIFGRRRDLQQLKTWIREGRRLVSIVAAGGMGKTRLAIELARGVSAEREVCFVTLPAGACSSDQLAAALATALRLPQSAGEATIERLLAYLRSRDILIVLDNAEGVSDDKQVIGAILDACGTSSFVLTSRAVMVWPGEVVYKLDGLDTSSGDADFTSSPAAMLFAQAARSLNPDFAFEEADGGNLRTICEAVRGAPLALQLVAQWLSIWTLQEIAEKLASNAIALADFDAGANPLRAIFDASWSLLDVDHRRGLAAVSIFPADFDNVAAHQVAGVMSKVMMTLERKSLLERRGNHRFALHPLTKGFAVEQLAASQQREALAEQHAKFFMQELENLALEMLGPGQAKMSERLRLDLGNFRAAWHWVVNDATNAPTVEVAETTFYLYVISGLFAEALDIFEATPSDRRLQAAFLSFRGNCLIQLGRADEAEVACRMALELAHPDDAKILAHAHQGLANVYHRRAAWADAEGHYRSALALRDDELLGRAYTTMSLAWLELQRGDLSAAMSWVEESEVTCAEIGFMFGLFVLRTCKGDVTARRGDYASALAAYRGAMALKAAISNDSELGVAYVKMGHIQRRLGDVQAARACFDDAFEIATGAGDLRIRVRALTGLASLRDAASNERRNLFSQALRGSLDTRNPIDASQALLEAARFEAGEGRQDVAGALFAAARDLDAVPLLEYAADLAEAKVDVSPRPSRISVWQRIEVLALESANA